MEEDAARRLRRLLNTETPELIEDKNIPPIKQDRKEVDKDLLRGGGPELISDEDAKIGTDYKETQVKTRPPLSKEIKTPKEQADFEPEDLEGTKVFLRVDDMPDHTKDATPIVPPPITIEHIGKENDGLLSIDTEQESIMKTSDIASIRKNLVDLHNRNTPEESELEHLFEIIAKRNDIEMIELVEDLIDQDMTYLTRLVFKHLVPKLDTEDQQNLANNFATKNALSYDVLKHTSLWNEQTKKLYATHHPDMAKRQRVLEDEYGETPEDKIKNIQQLGKAA